MQLETAKQLNFDQVNLPRGGRLERNQLDNEVTTRISDPARDAQALLRRNETLAATSVEGPGRVKTAWARPRAPKTTPG